MRLEQDRWELYPESGSGVKLYASDFAYHADFCLTGINLLPNPYNVICPESPAEDSIAPVLNCPGRIASNLPGFEINDYDGTHLTQTFTAASSGLLTSIAVSTDQVYFSDGIEILQVADASTPTGSVIGVIPSGVIDSGVHIFLEEPVMVQQGSTYALNLGSTYAYVNVTMDDSYVDGAFFINGNPNPDWDLIFETNVTVVPIVLDAAGNASIALEDLDIESYDACGIQGIEVLQTQFDCDDIGELDILVTATDNSGLQSECTVKAEVIDDLPPTVTCPPTISLQCYPDDPVAGGGIEASDNCQGQLEIAYSDDSPEVSDCGITINRTWEVTDPAGNTASCVQVININDDTPPVLSVPPDSDRLCDADPSVEGVATATDNCTEEPVVSFVDDTLQTCPIIVHRTWSAVDDCGNVASQVQTVVVSDWIAPEFTCEDLYVDCSDDVEAQIQVWLDGMTAIDNCSEVDIQTDYSFDNFVPACGSSGVIEVSFWAFDECFNSTFCPATIYITDNAAPVISGVVDVTVECGTDPAATGVAIAIDACDGPVATDYTDGPLGGNPQSFTRMWTAVDACGNEAQYPQLITIDDITPPVISCPENLELQCDGSDLLSAVEDWLGQVSASDNCSAAIISSDFNPLDIADVCPGGAELTISIQASDESGNASTCIRTVTVASLVLGCPNDLVLECADPSIDDQIADWLDLVTVVDGCEPVTVTNDFDWANFNSLCGGSGTIHVTFSGTDDCGRSTQCVRTIYIQDNTPPVVNCPPPLSLECGASCNTALIFTWLSSATASDDCGEATVTSFIDPIEFAITCDETGSFVVPFTARDECGNVATCNGLITISDTQGPEIQGPGDITVECGDPLAIDEVEIWLSLFFAADQCGSAGPVQDDFLSLDDATPCTDGDQVAVTFTAIDEFGNESELTRYITFEDTQAPVLECPPSYAIESNPTTLPEPAMASVFDECEGVLDVEGELFSHDTIGDYGTLVYSYIAEDACGNAAVCYQTITYFVGTFDAPPVAVCLDITVELDETGNASISPYDVDDASQCAAGELTLSLSQSEFGCGDVGVVPVTLTYTDADGDESSCTANVTVADNEEPVFSVCPEDMNVVVEEGANGATVEYDMPEASDNCGLESLSLTEGLAGGSDFPMGLTVVTWVAVDPSGNGTACSFNVLVDDTGGDADGDGIPNDEDNCPSTPNSGQADSDQDGVGNACDQCPGQDDNEDPDGDGIPACLDNCPLTSNPLQEDADSDGVGDVCDNCPADANSGQADADGDGVGNKCDACPGVDDFLSTDGDTIPDCIDNCPLVANNDQADADNDGVGDVCDNCPNDANSGQADNDGDGVGNKCDACPGVDDLLSEDGDTIPDCIDNCPLIANNDQADADNDGVGDVCDNCPVNANSGQADSDGDGVGNKCDQCPDQDDNEDPDGDGVPACLDNCPSQPNPLQEDMDGDGVGDVCDNCPDVANSGQADDDGDGIGNKCDNDPLSRPDGGEALGRDIDQDAARDTDVRQWGLQPNPARRSTQLQLGEMIGSTVDIIVHDNLGQIALDQKVGELKTSKVDLDIHRLPAGTYFVTLRVDGLLTSAKPLIVQE